MINDVYLQADRGLELRRKPSPTPPVNGSGTPSNYLPPIYYGLALGDWPRSIMRDTPQPWHSLQIPPKPRKKN